MASRGGFLIVERYVSHRQQHSSLKDFDIRASYRGFDGNVWPGEFVRSFSLIDGLAPYSELEKLMPYWTKVADPAMDLIYCSFGEHPNVQSFTFLGFDVGYFCSEYLHYSVVLNEVIYGSHASMAAYADALNSNLLISTERGAHELLAVRRAATRAGAELETGDEELEPIAIFAMPRPPVRIDDVAFRMT